jgi:hypothetical protein
LLLTVLTHRGITCKDDIGVDITWRRVSRSNRRRRSLLESED